MDVSTEGWDSAVIAYPCVITEQGKTLMSYAGNGFACGRFGYAELEVVLDGL
jgi:hypothetical protein